jgi:hypothetical protein
MQRGLPWFEEAARNIRYAVRQLRKSPGFAITAILDAGAGYWRDYVGVQRGECRAAEAACVSRSERLVVMREAMEEPGRERSAEPDNYLHYVRLKKESKTLEDAAIFQQRGMSVSQRAIIHALWARW